MASLQLLSPARLGGFGIPSAVASVEAAYIASVALASRYLITTGIMTLGITPAIRNTLPLVSSAYNAIAHLRNRTAPIPDSIALVPLGADLFDHYNQAVGPQVVAQTTGILIRGSTRPKKAPTTHLGHFANIQRILTSQRYDADHKYLRDNLLARSANRRRSLANSDKFVARRHLARLDSCCGLLSGTLWNIMPTEAALEIDDDTMVINAHVRLGVPVTAFGNADAKIKTCICNKSLDPNPGVDDPNHFHVCNRLMGPLLTNRHDAVKTTVAAFIKKSGGSYVVEPKSQSDSINGSSRVDITGSFAGFTFAIDVAGVLPTSNHRLVYLARAIPGSSAEETAQMKIVRHGAEAKRLGQEFFPFIMETMGTWHPTAQALCKRIATEAAKNSGDPFFNVNAFYTNMIQCTTAAFARGNAHIVRQGMLKVRFEDTNARSNGFPVPNHLVHDPLASIQPDVAFVGALAAAAPRRAGN